MNVLLLQTTHMDKSAPIFWGIFLNEDSFVQGLTTLEASDTSVNSLPPSLPTALPICHALAMDPGWLQAGGPGPSLLSTEVAPVCLSPAAAHSLVSSSTARHTPPPASVLYYLLPCSFHVFLSISAFIHSQVVCSRVHRTLTTVTSAISQII